jgi:hypothetical protein
MGKNLTEHVHYSRKFEALLGIFSPLPEKMRAALPFKMFK